ncbi:uncharacterized protein LOC126971508 [Leptidea sinapis]|uniref:uncharacterized protein LOC126971508 n=1 Tax=Leptidea sinapis TaxID=189913 RepID=UPI0021C41B77|nr:uncharacterized protein LOC126971508 [Leptidea sinapis]
MDVKKILNLLAYSSNDNLQLKYFSSLGANLISNSNNADIIIKYNALYEKIQQCLRSGRHPFVAVALNLVFAMLSVETTEEPSSNRRTLHIHAQNMLKLSGCLITMCDIFTNMMHQDTWRVLCCCLAEACRGSTLNQSICSHLVPLCIQHCQRGNLDVIVLLESLINKHDRNANLFFANNGMAIFKREALQNLPCLHLLNAAIENVPFAYIGAILEARKVFHDLHMIAHMHGPSSQVAKWKSVILYSREKVFGKYNIKESQNIIHYDDTENNALAKEECSLPKNSFKKDDNTTTLFNNILQEVETHKAIDRQYHSNHHSNILNQYLVEVPNIGEQSQQAILRRSDRDLSFSFLKLPHCHPYIENHDINSRIPCTNNNNEESKIIINKKYEGNHKKCVRDSFSFTPLYASTPKVSDSFRKKTNSNRFGKIPHRDRRQYRIPISNKNNARDTLNVKNSLSNRSLSSKILNALNSSCTTIVQGLQNMFKRKTINDTREKMDIRSKKNNYSFTNYMNIRDNVLSDSDGDNNFSRFSHRSASECSTCNSSAELRRKSKSDPSLRITIKKLKLGMMIYGCDFKRIAKTYWPNEKYVTPRSLYNLYRKVILKK